MNVIFGWVWRDVPGLRDNLTCMRCYRAFVSAAVHWWAEEEKKATDKARQGKKGG